MPASSSGEMEKVRLFFISFLILFSELVLIRFVPANVRLIGYFTNLILIASFLGMGVGILMTRRKLNIFPAFPLLLAFLVIIIGVFKIQVNIPSENAIFFSSNLDDLFQLEPEQILPFVFLLVAFIFAALGQYFGRSFEKFKPLAAYSIDILGSLSGIILFSILSYFWAPPFLWFLVIAAAFLLLLFRKQSVKENAEQIKIAVACFSFLIVLIISLLNTDKMLTWSPYYKITVNPYTDSYTGNQGYALNVNNIAHQFISTYTERTPFYYAPYNTFKNFKPQQILIIGAGTGTDVSTTLHMDKDVKHIDAVEIDPAIYQYGKKLNQDKPFSDPRVTVHIDDGRDFIQNASSKYDLIIYALPDSLTLSSNSSNIRLESFLFTKEAFQLAKDHLNPNGLFSVYNFYREDWLIDKIASVFTDVFGYPPHVITYGQDGKAASFFAGPTVEHAYLTDSSIKPYYQTQDIEGSSDDWPFLYLENRSLPPFYVKFILILSAVSIALVALTKVGEKEKKFSLRFFLFGAGFMLLETKSLVTFGLLFGNTWIVNSLVISGILIFVLLANLLSQKITVKQKWIVYIPLIGILLLNYFVPSTIFLKYSFEQRLIFSSTFYFLPIFFANMLFSQMFKNTDDMATTFGSNILGAVLGGFMEYSSLLWGYKILTLFIAGFYLLSLLPIKKIGILKID